jgi:voltage-gated potassium channel
MLKNFLHSYLSEDETSKTQRFDFWLSIIIIFNVLILILESINNLFLEYKLYFFVIEAILTGFFTIEYFSRIWISKNKRKYVKSFYGVIDLLSIIPFYISLLFPGAQSLGTIRILRLFRLLRIFKLVHAVHESKHLLNALKASLPKISVFMG